MPKSAELANTILGLVADEFEVSVDEILSKSKTLEIVDARHTAIKLMHINKMYPSRIAQVFGWSVRSIYLVLTQYDNRLKTNPVMRSNYERIVKKLRSNSEVIA